MMLDIRNYYRKIHQILVTFVQMFGFDTIIELYSRIAKIAIKGIQVA